MGLGNVQKMGGQAGIEKEQKERASLIYSAGMPSTVAQS